MCFIGGKMQMLRRLGQLLYSSLFTWKPKEKHITSEMEPCKLTCKPFCMATFTLSQVFHSGSNHSIKDSRALSLSHNKYFDQEIKWWSFLYPMWVFFLKLTVNCHGRHILLVYKIFSSMFRIKSFTGLTHFLPVLAKGPVRR